MVAANGTVKVLDMGLARSLTADRDKLTENLDGRAVLGTADFVAPEQALGDAPVDTQTNIYSLGATPFALITGRPPFAGTTAQKLLHHQLRDAPNLAELDRAVASGLATVVARMLEKRPTGYQTPAKSP